MSGRARAGDPGMDRIDRRLGWYIALVGLAMAAGGVIASLTDGSESAPWWVIGEAAIVAAYVTLVAGGPRLSMGMLRAHWIAIPLASIVLQATTFLGSAGAGTPDERSPWIWALEPASFALLSLVAPAPLALAAATVSVLTPLAAAVVTVGRPTEAVLVATPGHLLTIAVVLIAIGLRARLRALRQVELAVEASERLEVMRRAEEMQQRALTRIVHDDVLAVLTAALQLGGTTPIALRAEALATLAALDAAVSTAPTGAPIHSEIAAATFVERLRAIDPSLSLTAVPLGGSVPSEVMVAVTAATAEAVRNSIRHAGPARRTRVQARVGVAGVRVQIVDHGRGFAPDDVGPERLGLRESVRGRMAALPGGESEVHSAPGEGTEVIVRWRP